MKRSKITNTIKFCLTNAGFLLDGREKVFDAFRGSMFPFKTTDTHPDDLERRLTTAPIIEEVYLNTMHHPQNQD